MNAKTTKTNAPNRRVSPIQGLRRWWDIRREYAGLAETDKSRRAGWDRNEDTQPPENVECHLALVTVCEVFTPSTLSNLRDGLIARGWHTDSSGRRDLSDWIDRERVGGGGSWHHVGLVRPSGTGLGSLPDEMPDGIAAIDLTLVALTPTATVLLAAFLPDDATATGYNDVLKSDFETEIRLLPKDQGQALRRIWWRIKYGPGWLYRRGHSVVSPRFLRTEAASQYVSAVTAEAEEWLRDRLPGVFSGSASDGGFPGAVLFEVRSAKETIAGDSHWERAAGLGSSWDRWTTSEWPGASLTLPRHDLRTNAQKLTIALWPESDGETSESLWSLQHHAIDLTRGLVARWALFGVAQHQRTDMARARDLLTVSTLASPLRSLAKLRSEVLGPQLDATLLAADARHLAEDEATLKFDTVEFTQSRGNGGDSIGLLDALSVDLTTHASRIDESNRIVGAATVLATNLTATMSAIRTQRLALAISTVSLIVAVIAVILVAGQGT